MINGPVEQALVLAIRAHENPDLPLGLRLEMASVEPSTKPVVGEFKVDLRPLLPSGIAVTKTMCKRVAASFGTMASIDSAVAIPPRVYFTIDLAFLYDQVVETVLKEQESYGRSGRDHPKEKLTLVSFSSPNANKPLHLGHLRNNFIGMALANLLEDHGYDVKRVEVISDWGVHICQAALAYRKWGNGSTPESMGIKGDHFVGHYYVMFHERNRGEGDEPTHLEQEAAALLRKIESGNKDAIHLSKVITTWAEQGIRETYERIGSFFDGVFHEQESLKTARAILEKALIDGTCQMRSDGSVYVDLTDQDLGEVTLARHDGTQVVYALMLGFNVDRYNRYPFERSVVVSGRQWEFGASVVYATLRKLGYDWVSRTERVHYGMVSLPQGKMKSREGVVVTADGLLDEVHDRLIKGWEDEPTGSDAPPDSEAPPDSDVCYLLAVGLVKYHFLRVKTNKEILYQEQVLWERTLPKFAAVVAALRLADKITREEMLDAAQPRVELKRDTADGDLRGILLQMNAFPRLIEECLFHNEPALMVRYLDELCLWVKKCQQWFAAKDPLWKAVSVVLRRGLALLNIELPPSLEHLPPQFR